MSISRLLACKLFDIVASVGRPIGGVRPRRLAHYLSHRGYGQSAPTPDDFRWYRDRHGIQMRLHPYFLIDREIIAFGAYELSLQRFIDRSIHDGMVCMDVGANIGAVALHLAQRVGANGRVYGFEPVPENARRLNENVLKNSMQDRVRVVQSALSDADSTLSLSVAAATHANQGMGSLVEIDHGDLINTISVRSARLDSFCAAESLTRLDFIKVDIQGAEPLFLAGAQRTLETFRPRVVMEVAPSSLKSTGYSSRELLANMESIGYAAWTLTSAGTLGSRLTASACDPQFTAENVVFEHQQARAQG